MKTLLNFCISGLSIAIAILGIFCGGAIAILSWIYLGVSIVTVLIALGYFISENE
ncbi:hypothetical protein FACS1894105_04370 [Clostridia bacterium]|nr:hypothetical protein FACS1894105_04370 [Clostridia bacterium]